MKVSHFITFSPVLLPCLVSREAASTLYSPKLLWYNVQVSVQPQLLVRCGEDLLLAVLILWPLHTAGFADGSLVVH